MNNSSLLKITAAAVLSVTAAAWLMAEDQPYKPSQRADQIRTTGNMEMRNINKCSELIGMEVKNAQGEKLGEIQDVVIDFTSDRVGYVVLSTSKGVLSAEKLHAVPLRAFQPGSDGRSLTLNADKQKLAASEGFTKENWPNPSSPSWGAEPFWNEKGIREQHNQQYRDTQQQRDTTPAPRSSDTTPGTMPNRNNSPGQQ